MANTGALPRDKAEYTSRQAKELRTKDMRFIIENSQ
jgi:hypothetical protein